MTEITVLITVFRKRRKAAILSKPSPSLYIRFSNPILTPDITYRAVSLVPQTSHSHEFAMNVLVMGTSWISEFGK